MSEVIVLDTHIWFWLMTQEFGRFPAHWREPIEIAQTVGVSAMKLLWHTRKADWNYLVHLVSGSKKH